MLTTEFDRVYTQKLITLCDLENNGMTIMEVIGIIQKRLRLILRRHSSTGFIVGVQIFSGVEESWCPINCIYNN